MAFHPSEQGSLMHDKSASAATLTQTQVEEVFNLLGLENDEDRKQITDLSQLAQKNSLTFRIGMRMDNRTS